MRLKYPTEVSKVSLLQRKSFLSHTRINASGLTLNLERHLKWFKHYANAHESEILSEIIEKLGYEGYGLYWRLFEIIASNFDGENTSFSFRTSMIKRSIGIRTLVKLQHIANICSYKLSIDLKITSELIEVEAPILLKLKDRDFKNTRKKRDKNALEENRKEERRGEYGTRDFAALDVSSAAISYLNEKLGTKFKPNSQKTLGLVKSRVKEGFTESDFIQVIKTKHHEWGGDAKMRKFLRPETLFGTKFESYLNQGPVKTDEDILKLMGPTETTKVPWE